MVDVWMLNYRQTFGYQPRTTVAKGEPKELKLEDETQDGGYNLFNPSWSGRRVSLESIPRKLVWRSRQKSTEYQWTTIYSVTDKLKKLIEKLEANVHQFVSVDIVTPGDMLIEKRWFWQICNRLDTLDPSTANWTENRRINPYAQTGRGTVFDVDKVGEKHFWCDKYVHHAFFCSDKASRNFVSNGITGCWFREMGSIRHN